MAIISSLAIGKARKSAGNLTFATIQGRTIAREKPAFVRNPNTPKQLAQRSKMSNVVAAYRAFGGLVKKYFTTLPKYTSQYNEFVSRNISIAERYLPDGETGNVSGLVGTTVSRGSIQIIQNNGPKLALGNHVEGAIKLMPGFSAVEGDEIVTLAFDSLTNTLKSDVYKLRTDEIELLNNGGSFFAEADFEGSQIECAAVLYYSPSRNSSSTAQLTVLPTV